MADQLTAVAGATVECRCKPCPLCDNHASHTHKFDGGGGHVVMCSDCKGTGRVFALPDAARVHCKTCAGSGSLWTYPQPEVARTVRRDCPECQGRGWSASTDLAEYVSAAGECFNTEEFTHLLEEWLANLLKHIEPLKAFLDALARALEAQGAVLWTPEPA